MLELRPCDFWHDVFLRTHPLMLDVPPQSWVLHLPENCLSVHNAKVLGARVTL
jgi:hypothetical protein